MVKRKTTKSPPPPALRSYQHKRDFSRSPEPPAEIAATGVTTEHLFVIHKHAASRLHYDLRLESEGVLKSWAIPRGPSLDPLEQRLSVRVEDHPLNYCEFEAVIPKGNYGAGTMMIWDRGTYQLYETLRGETHEQAFMRQYRKGSLKIELRGKKVSGKFTLVKIKKSSGDDWLLIKKRDASASIEDVLQNDISVHSGLSMDEISVKFARPKVLKTPVERPKVLLTNPQKIFWTKERITKGDLFEYYRTMSAVMVPHLRDRPQSLNRHPNGIGGKSFFQKEVAGSVPGWIATTNVISYSGQKTVTYLLCQDADTLLYMINMGCIELNAWLSKLPDLTKPTHAVIDIDPGTAPFIEVIRAATFIRSLLEKIGAASFCKTSGGRGIHIYIPTNGAAEFADCQRFAELVGRCLQFEMPEITSIARSPLVRRDKIYIDSLQNRRGQTMACVYAVRPRPGAPVSTPIKWEEITAKLDPSEFNMRTVAGRVDKVGDLWSGMEKEGMEIGELNRKLQEIMMRKGKGMKDLKDPGDRY